MKKYLGLGVIFDLDGIVVNTDKIHSQAWESVCAGYGLRFDAVCAEATRGLSRIQSVKRIVQLNNQSEKFGETELERICHAKNAIYRTLIKGITQDNIVDGFFGLWRHLKDHGTHIGMASSSKNAWSILRLLSMDKGVFDYIVTGDEITLSKPNPQAFIKCAEGLGFCCEDCAVIEDSLAGVQAAVSAKTYPVYVGYNRDCMRIAKLSIDDLKRWNTLDIFAV